MQFHITWYCRHCDHSNSIRQDTSNSVPTHYADGPEIALKCSLCGEGSGLMQVNYNLPDNHRPEVIRALQRSHVDQSRSHRS